MPKIPHFSFFLILNIILLLSIVGFIGSYNLLNQPKDVIFDITAKKFEYSPSSIIVNKGDTVTLRIRSLDNLHGFYLDAYNFEKEIPALVTTTITFVANREGKFTFRCSVTCGNFHPYMLGEIKIQPNNLFYAGIVGLGFVSMVMITGVYISVQRYSSKSPETVIYGEV